MSAAGNSNLLGILQKLFSKAKLKGLYPGAAEANEQPVFEKLCVSTIRFEIIITLQTFWFSKVDVLSVHFFLIVALL